MAESRRSRTRRDHVHPETPIHDADIVAAILRLLADRPIEASICPSEAARTLQSDERGWRALMPRVREVARQMATDRQLSITQRNATLDPGSVLRGPVRLRRGARFPSSG